MRARVFNWALDVFGWLFEQQGIGWPTWRSLSVEMRREGSCGYRKES